MGKKVKYKKYKKIPTPKDINAFFDQFIKEMEQAMMGQRYIEEAREEDLVVNLMMQNVGIEANLRIKFEPIEKKDEVQVLLNLELHGRGASLMKGGLRQFAESDIKAALLKTTKAGL